MKEEKNKKGGNKMNHKKTILTGAVVIAIAALILPVMIQAGSLEPTAAPAPTMKTLDQIPPTWSQKITGSARFDLVLGGAGVLDKETGLVWARNANLAGAKMAWEAAINYCIYDLLIGGRLGWRLPSIEELSSLVDKTQISPALPSGHLFTNVLSQGYWSATTIVTGAPIAWVVGFAIGDVVYPNKASLYNAWCVRGGPGYDAR